MSFNALPEAVEFAGRDFGWRMGDIEKNAFQFVEDGGVGAIAFACDDLAKQAIEREEATCKHPVRAPAELSNEQLLMLHEQAGPVGELRAAALRKKTRDERQTSPTTEIPAQARFIPGKHRRGG